MRFQFLFHHLSVLLARAYYRVTAAGDRVPVRGPLLLVANHPNSLLDPALVSVAARRPVRFLARAPLFDHPALGWFVQGMGAIPIYRPADDPELVARNERTFRAVWQALAHEGAAVGIFPEGLTHGAPSLAPLKTGAARIALGAASLTGAPFPIMPVGLTFRAKEEFRSEALALIGRPVHWADLAPEPGLTPASVRELTRRIAGRLEEVTLNLEQWEDAPVVEAVQELAAAELGAGEEPADRLRRAAEVGRALAEARRGGTEEWQAVTREVLRHRRVLSLLHLRPRDLRTVPSATLAVRWTLRNLLFFGLLAPLALLGELVFWAPKRFVSLVEERLQLNPEVRATYKVLGGGFALTSWGLLLAILAWRTAGWAGGLAVLAVLPILGLAMLLTHGRWRRAVQDLRRFLVLRERSDLRSRLLSRQRQLGERIEDLQKQPRRIEIKGVRTVETRGRPSS